MWSRWLATLPEPVQEAVRLSYVAAQVTSDRRSLRTYIRLARMSEPAADGGLARMRLRALNGNEVLLRPATSDLATVWGTFARAYHLPPPELGEPDTIWDLGANIGLTMAHFAALYPRARILGVELDADNVALAGRNLAPWADRCELLHAAVWPKDGEVRYRGWPGGTSNYQADEEASGPSVPAVSLNTLVRERGGPVDYLKLDVEGAERRLLREQTGWAELVRCLKVEVHGDYDAGDCEADLRALGYRTRVDRGCVVGARAP